MTDNQIMQCHGIIHAAATSAAAVSGFSAQIPCADNLVLSGIEIGMVVALGGVFGVHVTCSMAESLVAAQVGTLGGRCISQLLIGWIPGVGNVTNAVTAAGVVESLGWVFVDRFEREAALFRDIYSETDG